MKRCMYCGHENEDANKHCVKCGNPLLDTPSEEVLPIEEVPDETIPETTEVPDVEVGQDDLGDVFDAGKADEAAAEYGYLPEQDLGGQQPDPQVYNGQGQVYNGQPQTYTPDQQYAGQAYGYGQQPREYGEQPYDQQYNQQYNQQPYDQGYPMYDDRQDMKTDRFGGITPIMKKARRRVKSPLMFLMLLIFTAHCVLSILNVVLGNAVENLSTVSHTVTKMTGENVAVNFMNSIVQLVKGVNPLYLLGGGLICLIPTVLLVFGLWVTFMSTTNKKPQISSAGYNLVITAVVVKFIGVCAALLGVIAFSVAFVVSAGASSSVMSLIAGVIVLLIMIILTVFAILYYVQVIFSVRIVKNNARTGREIGRIPGFIIFVDLLGCAVTLLSMLPMAPDDYIGLAATGSYAAWLLLCVLWTIIYKATVKNKVK